MNTRGLFVNTYFQSLLVLFAVVSIMPIYAADERETYTRMERTYTRMERIVANYLNLMEEVKKNRNLPRLVHIPGTPKDAPRQAFMPVLENLESLFGNIITRYLADPASLRKDDFDELKRGVISLSRIFFSLRETKLSRRLIKMVRNLDKAETELIKNEETELSRQLINMVNDVDKLEMEIIEIDFLKLMEEAKSRGLPLHEYMLLPGTDNVYNRLGSIIDALEVSFARIVDKYLSDPASVSREDLNTIKRRTARLSKIFSSLGEQDLEQSLLDIIADLDRVKVEETL